MKGHLYQVTVQQLEDAQGNAVDVPPVVFAARNHDELAKIVERVQTRDDFDTADEAAAFAIGLKLFSEVMLHHRDNPLFEPLLPHFGEFMQRLKKR